MKRLSDVACNLIAELVVGFVFTIDKLIDLRRARNSSPRDSV